jgi:dTMP kinase
MRSLQRGILIALEGIDGSGKTTLAHRLALRFENDQLPVILTKEPGATELGKDIRVLVQSKDYSISPEAEAFLFAADRAQHIAQVVKPALANNYLVISDRMADSSRAYQGFGRGVDRDLLEAMIAGALQGITPDLVVYLALDAQNALARVRARQKGCSAEAVQAKHMSRIEKEGDLFYSAVAQGFETIFACSPQVLRLDALQEPQALEEEAYSLIYRWLIEHRVLHGV